MAWSDEFDDWEKYATVNVGDNAVVDFSNAGSGIDFGSILKNTLGLGSSGPVNIGTLAAKLVGGRYMTENLDPAQAGGFKKDEQGNWITDDRPAGDVAMLGSIPAGRPIPRSDANRVEVNEANMRRREWLRQQIALFQGLGNYNKVVGLMEELKDLQLS